MRDRNEQPVSREQEAGSAVRLLRRERDLTQRQLADKAGVSKSTVSLLEAGKGVRLESLLKICEALGAEIVIRSAPSFVIRQTPSPPPE